MIELRWVERKRQDGGHTTYVVNGNWVKPTERVLQYREGYYGLVRRDTGENLWTGSDWRDVPTEVETLGNESAAPSDDTRETK